MREEGPQGTAGSRIQRHQGGQGPPPTADSGETSPHWAEHQAAWPQQRGQLSGDEGLLWSSRQRSEQGLRGPRCFPGTSWDPEHRARMFTRTPSPQQNWQCRSPGRNQRARGGTDTGPTVSGRSSWYQKGRRGQGGRKGTRASAAARARRPRSRSSARTPGAPTSTAEGSGAGSGRHSLWGPHTSPCGGLPSTLPTSTAISWQEAESCPLRQDPWSLEPPAPVSHPASAWPPQFRVRAGTVVGRAWSSLEPSSACVSSSHTCSPTCSLTCRQVLSPGLHARLPPPHPAPPSANCLPTRRPPGRPGASARHRKTEQAGG